MVPGIALVRGNKKRNKGKLKRNVNARCHVPIPRSGAVEPAAPGHGSPISRNKHRSCSKRWVAKKWVGDPGRRVENGTREEFTEPWKTDRELAEPLRLNETPGNPVPANLPRFR
jgi:hypothetical protein